MLLRLWRWRKGSSLTPQVVIMNAEQEEEEEEEEEEEDCADGDRGPALIIDGGCGHCGVPMR